MLIRQQHESIPQSDVLGSDRYCDQYTEVADWNKAEARPRIPSQSERTAMSADLIPAAFLAESGYALAKLNMGDSYKPDDGWRTVGFYGEVDTDYLWDICAMPVEDGAVTHIRLVYHGAFEHYDLTSAELYRILAKHGRLLIETKRDFSLVEEDFPHFILKSSHGVGPVKSYLFEKANISDDEQHDMRERRREYERTRNEDNVARYGLSPNTDPTLTWLDL